MSGAIDLTNGPPETVLPAASAVALRRLAEALGEPPERRRDAVSDVAAAYPDWPEAWAELGTLARDDVEAYAYFRVGYHRGLDALRQAGWRGNGYVRWSEPSNRGFLRCLEGLRSAAGAIGEGNEEERCGVFLRQLDPAWRAHAPGDTGTAR